MYSELLHIYGPFSIHSYGLMVSVGLLVSAMLAQRHPLRKKIMSREAFINALLIVVFVGVIGGRIMFVVAEWESVEQWFDMFAFWQGGLSMLGSVIAIVVALPLYLKRQRVPILAYLDLIAIHAPLLEAFARIGCFLAGCCYGKPTDMPWGIIYTNYSSAAACMPIHPTQLYASVTSLGIFLLLYFASKKYYRKPGQLITAYLVLASLGRFIIDFFRGDRPFFAAKALQFFSIYQWIALTMAIAASILFYCISVGYIRTSRTS